MSSINNNRINSQKDAKRNACLYLLKSLLILMQTMLFAEVLDQLYNGQLYILFYYGGDYAIVLVYAVVFTLFAKLYGGLDVASSRTSDLVYSLGVAQVFAAFVQYGVLCLLTYDILTVWPMALLILAGMLLNVIWAKIAVKTRDRLFPPRRACVIYDYEEAVQAIAVVAELKWRFRVDAILNIDNGMDEILRTVEDMQAVFLCGLHSSERNTILKHCIANDIETYIRPKIGDLLMGSADTVHLQHVPFMYCRRNRKSIWYRAVKRGLDVVLSGLALLVLSPFMLATAIAIKAYDGGPVMYRQSRLTENGKQFSIMKFRSMRVDAEKDGIARLASEQDDRITPVGRFIRKVRIDELPQLFNILKGDMTIVGPRPERPEIAKQYEEELPEFALRLQVKAGLTGYAQVYGKYNTDPYDKLQMDLIYIAEQSLAQDLKLMFATVKVLFMPESTEGVAKGHIVAGSNSSDVEYVGSKK